MRVPVLRISADGSDRDFIQITQYLTQTITHLQSCRFMASLANRQKKSHVRNLTKVLYRRNVGLGHEISRSAKYR